MFIWDWFKDILYSYGFFQKTGNLVFLGLDAAGKTTLMYMLKENRVIQGNPTMYATSEELLLGNIKLTAYDIGGHRQVRKVWREYFPVADGIVFIIDVSKRSRLEEAKIELDSLFQ